MFTFSSQTSVHMLKSFRIMPEYFEKKGGLAVNLVYLVPDAKPEHAIMVPFKLLYHK